jgi:hypothetical protein
VEGLGIEIRTVLECQYPFCIRAVIVQHKIDDFHENHHSKSENKMISETETDNFRKIKMKNAMCARMYAKIAQKLAYRIDALLTFGVGAVGHCVKMSLSLF